MALEVEVRAGIEAGGGPSATPSALIALDALQVAGWMRSRSRETRWASDRIGTQVERIRAQLAPIRAGLEASFGREAFRSTAFEEGAGRDLEASPVRIAYAVRWLELGDGTDGPG
jgi:hypothetical protein